MHSILLLVRATFFYSYLVGAASSTAPIAASVPVTTSAAVAPSATASCTQTRTSSLPLASDITSLLVSSQASSACAQLATTTSAAFQGYGLECTAQPVNQAVCQSVLSAIAQSCVVSSNFYGGVMVSSSQTFNLSNTLSPGNPIKTGPGAAPASTTAVSSPSKAVSSAASNLVSSTPSRAGSSAPAGSSASSKAGSSASVASSTASNAGSVTSHAPSSAHSTPASAGNSGSSVSNLSGQSASTPSVGSVGLASTSSVGGSASKGSATGSSSSPADSTLGVSLSSVPQPSKAGSGSNTATGTSSASGGSGTSALSAGSVSSPRQSAGSASSGGSQAPGTAQSSPSVIGTGTQSTGILSISTPPGTTAASIGAVGSSVSSSNSTESGSTVSGFTQSGSKAGSASLTGPQVTSSASNSGNAQITGSSKSDGSGGSGTSQSNGGAGGSVTVTNNVFASITANAASSVTAAFVFGTGLGSIVPSAVASATSSVDDATVQINNLANNVNDQGLKVDAQNAINSALNLANSGGVGWLAGLLGSAASTAAAVVEGTEPVAALITAWDAVEGAEADYKQQEQEKSSSESESEKESKTEESKTDDKSTESDSKTSDSPSTSNSPSTSSSSPSASSASARSSITSSQASSTSSASSARSTTQAPSTSSAPSSTVSSSSSVVSSGACALYTYPGSDEVDEFDSDTDDASSYDAGDDGVLVGPAKRQLSNKRRFREDIKAKAEAPKELAKRGSPPATSFGGCNFPFGFTATQPGQLQAKAMKNICKQPNAMGGKNGQICNACPKWFVALHQCDSDPGFSWSQTDNIPKGSTQSIDHVWELNLLNVFLTTMIGTSSFSCDDMNTVFFPSSAPCDNKLQTIFNQLPSTDYNNIQNGFIGLEQSVNGIKGFIFGQGLGTDAAYLKYRASSYMGQIGALQDAIMTFSISNDPVVTPMFDVTNNRIYQAFLGVDGLITKNKLTHKDGTAIEANWGESFKTWLTGYLGTIAGDAWTWASALQPKLVSQITADNTLDATTKATYLRLLNNIQSSSGWGQSQFTFNFDLSWTQASLILRDLIERDNSCPAGTGTASAVQATGTPSVSVSSNPASSPASISNAGTTKSPSTPATTPAGSTTGSPSAKITSALASTPLPDCMADGAPWYSPTSWCDCGASAKYPTLPPTSGMSTANCDYTALPSATINPVSVSAAPTNIPGENGLPGCNYILYPDGQGCPYANYCDCGGTNVGLLTATVSGTASLNCDYTIQPTKNDCPTPTTTIVAPTSAAPTAASTPCCNIVGSGCQCSDGSTPAQDEDGRCCIATDNEGDENCATDSSPVCVIPSGVIPAAPSTTTQPIYGPTQTSDCGGRSSLCGSNPEMGSMCQSAVQRYSDNYMYTNYTSLGYINQANADFTGDGCAAFFQCGGGSDPELVGPYPSGGVSGADIKQAFSILGKTCSVCGTHTLQDTTCQVKLDACDGCVDWIDGVDQDPAPTTVPVSSPCGKKGRRDLFGRLVC